MKTLYKIKFDGIVQDIFCVKIKRAENVEQNKVAEKMERRQFK